MAKKKVSVTFAGQTFTRATNRTYTHVVLCKSDYEKDLQNAKNNAAADIKINWDYYVREAGASPRFKHEPAEITRFQEIVAPGFDGATKAAIANAVAKIEQQKTNGYYEKFGAYSWCGRIDLARAQANKAAEWNTDVTIVPVPGA